MDLIIVWQACNWPDEELHIVCVCVCVSCLTKNTLHVLGSSSDLL